MRHGVNAMSLEETKPAMDQLRASGAVNCAVYAAATQQRGVRGVHDGIYLQLGDIALNGSESLHTLFYLTEDRESR